MSIIYYLKKKGKKEISLQYNVYNYVLHALNDTLLLHVQEVLTNLCSKLLYKMSQDF